MDIYWLIIIDKYLKMQIALKRRILENKYRNLDCKKNELRFIF